MIGSLDVVTIVVENRDEAFEFYTDRLGFGVRSDEQFSPGAKWVTVAPADQNEVEIHLQEPDPNMHDEEGDERQRELVGRGPTWSLHTDDREGTCEELRSAGVSITSESVERPYGVEAVFEDPY